MTLLYLAFFCILLRILPSKMSFEEKFNAAVELIHALPKEGQLFCCILIFVFANYKYIVYIQLA